MKGPSTEFHSYSPPAFSEQNSKHHVPRPSHFMTPCGKLCCFICNTILPPGGNKPAITTVIFPFLNPWADDRRTREQNLVCLFPDFTPSKLIISSLSVPCLKYVLVLCFPPYLWSWIQSCNLLKLIYLPIRVDRQYYISFGCTQLHDSTLVYITKCSPA